MVIGAVAAFSGGALSGCLAEITLQAFIDYLSRSKAQKAAKPGKSAEAKQEVQLRAKVQRQFLSGLSSGALTAVLKVQLPATIFSVRRKLLADLSNGLEEGSLAVYLRAATQKEALKLEMLKEEANVREKAQSQFLLSLNSGSLSDALSSDAKDEERLAVRSIKAKLHANFEKGLANGSLNRSLSLESTKSKAEAKVRAKLQSQFLESLNSGALAATLDRSSKEWSMVKQKVLANLSMGLKEGSLQRSLRYKDLKPKASTEAHDDTVLRAKMQSQLLSNLTSGSLAASLSNGSGKVKSKLQADLSTGLENGSLRAALNANIDFEHFKENADVQATNGDATMTYERKEQRRDSKRKWRSKKSKNDSDSVIL